MPRIRTGSIVAGDPFALHCMRRQLRYSEDVQRQRQRCAVSWQSVRKTVLKISKRRVAALCGVSRATVDRWEDPASDSLPDLGHISALCTEYDISIGNMLLVMGQLHKKP